MKPNEILDVAYKLSVIGGFGSTFLLVMFRGGRIADGMLSLIKIRKSIEEVVKEVRPNGGASMKDVIGQLKNAQDRQETRVETLERKTDEQTGILKDQNEMLAANQRDMRDLKDRFSRFVKHEADNDLHYSKLAEEERKRAREIEGDQGKT